MKEYGYGERPIDVLFVGGYSRHHSARSKTLKKIARLAETQRVLYCLDASRLTRLAESSLGRLLPLQKHRRPDVIAKIAGPPFFGRQLYELIGKSKIMLNGTIDMAGQERGNIRCFEAVGCGALLVSDAGNYPEGMVANETIVPYDTSTDCLDQIRRCLTDWTAVKQIAANGRHQIENLYTKERQWALFNIILGSL